MFQQRQRYYQTRRQAGPASFVMPFVIIICIGIIGILIFNLWRAFFPSEKVKAAYLHLVEGSAQMKAWGTDSFFNLSSDAVIMQGDQIRSSADAKLIVEFFDGSLMRLGGNTDVSFDSVDDESETPLIELHLYGGNLWFNLLNKNTGVTNVFVTLDNVVAKSNLASIFELENNQEKIVRVFSVFDNEGLDVDVLAEDGSKVVESEKVGVGQEIVFTDEVLKSYWSYKSPTVLAAIDDDFKLSGWYLWNLNEDNKPSEFEKTLGPEGSSLVKVEPEVLKKEEIADLEPEKKSNSIAESDTKGDQQIISNNSTGISLSAKPSISSVAGGAKLDDQGRYLVSSRVATLTGSVNEVDKVVVNGYTLEKFKPGDKTWTYFANADFDLMKKGENIYDIYGIDADGNKTESLIIKVFYTPQPLPGETTAIIVNDNSAAAAEQDKEEKVEQE